MQLTVLSDTAYLNRQKLFLLSEITSNSMNIRLIESFFRIEKIMKTYSRECEQRHVNYLSGSHLNFHARS